MFLLFFQGLLNRFYISAGRGHFFVRIRERGVEFIQIGQTVLLQIQQRLCHRFQIEGLSFLLGLGKVLPNKF